MTKLNEQILFDADGKLIVKQQHDFHSVAEKAKSLQSAGQDGFGKENKLVGVLPMKLIYEAAKARGIDHKDQNAMKELVLSLLHDRDFSQFRVWEGNLR